VIYVACQRRLTLGTYGHIMDEFENSPRVDSQAATTQARDAIASGTEIASQR
jgi:hypothetical protein